MAAPELPQTSVARLASEVTREERPHVPSAEAQAERRASSVKRQGNETVVLSPLAVTVKVPQGFEG